MLAEDGVRWLVLLSGAVLSYSTLMQLRWQRTQVERDEDTTRNDNIPPAEPSTTATQLADQEAKNILKFRETRNANAIRPFFDAAAYRYFLWGFAISVISAALDLLAHGPLKEFLAVTG